MDLFAYADDNGPAIVYQAMNTINGHAYIGVTRRTLQHRWRQHRWGKDRGRALHSAIRKYGHEAFALSVLAACPSYKAALAEEQRLIAQLKPEYNLTSGGEGVIGHRHSAASKRKMSAAKRGRGPWPVGECPAEVRAKLSEKKLGYKYEVVSEAQKRSVQNAAPLGHEARRRAVICTTEWLAFKSTTDAAKHYGVTTAGIVQYCRGWYKNRKGLEFAYVEDVYDELEVMAR